jgi:hypothetical protein
MVRHKKVYMEFFGIAPDEFVPCERCIATGRKDIQRAVDVHHADRRGMGGDQTGEKDVIENLGGVCRYCHDILDAIPEENEKFKVWLADPEKRKKVIHKWMYGG